MNEPIVRMYIDENGHQSLKGDLFQNNKRFLCMTGIIMQIREHDNSLTPMMNALKIKYFGNADIILHRRELIPAKPPFESLKDDVIREQFNHDFLQIVEKVQYRVTSVVIDKYILVQRFGLLRAQDPYALALEYLMQRYQYWMQDYKSLYGYCRGDILAEARGGGEDKVTRTAYNEIYKWQNKWRWHCSIPKIKNDSRSEPFRVQALPLQVSLDCSYYSMIYVNCQG